MQLRLKPHRSIKSMTIQYAELEPTSSTEIVGQHMLGFTNESWLAAYQKLGPAFKLKLDTQEHTVICGHKADLEAWRQADAWNYTDTDSGEFFRREMGDDHVTQLSGEAHRRSRKLILPAFGIKALQRDFNDIHVAMESAIASSTGEVDLFQVANFAYAKALANSQLKSGLEDDALKHLADFEDWFIAGLRIPPEQQVVFHNTKEYLAIKQHAFDLFERVFKERQSGQRPGDSLDMLMDNPPKEGLDPLSDQELTKAVYLLSVAGIGNIANILVAAVWLLNQHPEWLERLETELSEVPLDKMVEGIGQFRVMKAIVSEVERYYLPAPVIQKITTMEVDILGTKIPKNQSVLHVHGLSHYDPENYHDPFVFNPGRWLEGSPEKPHVFGGGKHLCLGMGVARLLAPLSLGILVKHYDIKPKHAPMSVKLAPHIETSSTTTSFPIELTRK